MRRSPAVPVLLLALAVAMSSLPSCASATPDDDEVRAVDVARAERVAQLTRPDGWLTLIGLHWLEPGDSSVGSGPGNGIRLAAGPASFGSVHLGPDNVVTFTPDPGGDVLVDGQPARTCELHPDGDKGPTLVQAGSVSFFVIRRGDRLALRVRDSESPRRTNFPGLETFPTDPTWRIEARWVPFDPPHETEVTNVLGQVSAASVPGKAVFSREGRTWELIPIDEGPGEPLFFVFADATSGVETYAAARFLDAEAPRDGKVVLDFNLARNPPCAFTPFATCPLPPEGNRLPFRVPAGEKAPKGEHP